MKEEENMKKVLLVGAAVTTVIFGGVTIAWASTDNQEAITAEQALKTAFAQADGFIEEVDLSFEEDDHYYEVEIESRTGEYEFQVDASTGKLLKSQDRTKEDAEEYDDTHYPNKPANLTSFTEYSTVVEQVDTNGLTFHLEKDNPGSRIMFLVNGDKEKQYKIIYKKEEHFLKIIDLMENDQVYSGFIS